MGMRADPMQGQLFFIFQHSQFQIIFCVCFMIADFNIEEFDAMIYSCSYDVTANTKAGNEQGGDLTGTRSR
jgi:hypothetical protein